MSYIRVSTTVASVQLADLGYTLVHPATNFVLSNQFGVEDLQNSESLRAAIAAGTLTCQVNLDGTWTAVLAADFDPKDVPGAFENLYEIMNAENNEDLVNGNDIETSRSGGLPLHIHDTRYFTKTLLQSTSAPSGASLIGVDQTNFTVLSGAEVQAVLDSIDNAFTNSVNLDLAYDNDSDGIMDIDGSLKPLNLRSDNINDVIISRKSGVDSQDALRLDVSANELLLGALISGALAQLQVRIKSDLIVDGSITYTGTITDTTVNQLEVTDANILLRAGATVGADAFVYVERGSTGPDADLYWNETTDRWMAGTVGTEKTIALLEANDVVTGVWEFTGNATTDPNLYLTQKTAAPTTQLGVSSQIPIAMINGILTSYDKTNGRNKFLSVSREYMVFVGRDSANNTTEYARIATFTSNQAGNRLIRDATLVGMSIQTNGSETWNARVRKNGSLTDLASLAAGAVAGAQDSSFNIDFTAGDQIQVYIDGTSIDRPVIKLEFAYRF